MCRGRRFGESDKLRAREDASCIVHSDCIDRSSYQVPAEATATSNFINQEIDHSTSLTKLNSTCQSVKSHNKTRQGAPRQTAEVSSKTVSKDSTRERNSVTTSVPSINCREPPHRSLVPEEDAVLTSCGSKGPSLVQRHV